MSSPTCPHCGKALDTHPPTDCLAATIYESLGWAVEQYDGNLVRFNPQGALWAYVRFADLDLVEMLERDMWGGGTNIILTNWRLFEDGAYVWRVTSLGKTVEAPTPTLAVARALAVVARGGQDVSTEGSTRAPFPIYSDGPESFTSRRIRELERENEELKARVVSLRRQLKNVIECMLRPREPGTFRARLRTWFWRLALRTTILVRANR